VNEHEKQEFWNSLARLYDETLALRESISELRGKSVELHEAASDLLQVAQSHQRAVEAHQRVAEAHERRLDKLEVVQEWLAEKERAREQRPQA